MSLAIRATEYCTMPPLESSMFSFVRFTDGVVVFQAGTCQFRLDKPSLQERIDSLKKFGIDPDISRYALAAWPEEKP